MTGNTFLACPLLKHMEASQHLRKKFESGYSHLSNSREGWNKRGGGAKVTKSLNVELGINQEGGIFGKN